MTYEQSFISTDNWLQNICQKVKQSRNLGKDQKILIPNFA